MNQIKNNVIGRGQRRLRYERRLRRLKDLPPSVLGEKLGLSVDDSIMLQEIMEYQIASHCEAWRCITLS